MTSLCKQWRLIKILEIILSVIDHHALRRCLAIFVQVYQIEQIPCVIVIACIVVGGLQPPPGVNIVLRLVVLLFWCLEFPWMGIVGLQHVTGC